MSSTSPQGSVRWFGGSGRPELKAQLRRAGPMAVACLVAAGAVLGAVIAIGQGTGRPLWDLTRDPAAITGSPSYLGILSNLGLMLWSAAVGVCWLAARVLARGGGDRREVRFLQASAAFSLLLLVDDALMLHERLLPNRLHVPERAVTLGYAVVAAAWLGGFARVIRRTDFLLLGAALAFLGTSVAVDALAGFSSVETFVEDAFKFAGIALWLGYFAHTGTAMVRRHLPSAGGRFASADAERQEQPADQQRDAADRRDRSQPARAGQHQEV